MGSSKRAFALRSRAWFDNPDNPGMTALYLERYLNFGLTLDGMGAGDFKLLAAIGAWFGYPALPAVVFIAASSGVIVGLILGFTGRREQGEAIAFGPHLCLGAACIAFAEQSLRPLLSP